MNADGVVAAICVHLCGDPRECVGAVVNSSTMQVTEIFFSIQGESTFTGRPCIFVRLTACNLRCVWCDSEYTFTGGVKMTLEQVLARVDAYPCKLVEITGGEPMLQEKEVLLLCRALLDRGCQVLIETSGER